jgi:hypothetical protein
LLPTRLFSSLLQQARLAALLQRDGLAVLLQRDRLAALLQRDGLAALLQRDGLAVLRQPLAEEEALISAPSAGRAEGEDALDALEEAIRSSTARPKKPLDMSSPRTTKCQHGVILERGGGGKGDGRDRRRCVSTARSFTVRSFVVKDQDSEAGLEREGS